MKMTCHSRFLESDYKYLSCCLWKLQRVLMDLCLVVVTIPISVPSSPHAPRPTSPMPHHLIIVDTDIVFHLPNSRLYHNQRHANIPVSSATTLMCSSSWTMEAVDVATMFTCALFPTHRICIVYTCESFSLLLTMLISFYLLWIIS